ncbi:MAG: hypothetical protein ACK4N4_11765 [Burkholderiales bacterium]
MRRLSGSVETGKPHFNKPLFLFMFFVDAALFFSAVTCAVNRFRDRPLLALTA